MKVIQIEDLGKRYQLGQFQPYKTLRESLGKAITYPIRAVRGVQPDKLEERAHRREILWALRHVSLEVEQGEVVGIIGKNGSGKSTLLKILARITAPTEGRVEFQGRVGSMLEVGTGFHPELTGRENVFLNGSILGMRKREIEKRFASIAEFSGVERFLDTPVKRYSSGMYVRLAFAVAAHLDPDILLVDEVLSVGDIEFQKKCLRMMGEFPKSGRTILFVSHNLWAVRRLCNRVILLQDGRIVSEGRPDDVIKDYIGSDSEGVENSGTLEPFKDSSLSDEIKGYQIIKVRLVDHAGKPIQEFYMSDGALVEITFKVTESGIRPRFSLALFDHRGQKIFGSLNNTDTLYDTPLDEGEYRTVCHLPGDFLNDGSFRISLTCGEANWSKSCRYDNILSFHCLDDGILRGDYQGEFTGPLRPRLRWNTQRVAEQKPEMKS